MESGEARIGRYRELLDRELPTATRRSVEWLMVNAVREHARLKPLMPSRNTNSAPRLMKLAQEALEEAIDVQQAQYGSIQIYVGMHDHLVLLTHSNFPASLSGAFACFKPDGRTACSRAVASNQRVIIEDVEDDELFAPHVPVMTKAGIRALQSTPLKNKSASVIGMISTHFAAPRSFSRVEISRMDAHVRQVSSEIARVWH